MCYYSTNRSNAVCQRKLKSNHFFLGQIFFTNDRNTQRCNYIISTQIQKPGGGG